MRQIADILILVCLAVSVALPLKAQETNWPRFQGAYLQMKDGELIQLPDLRSYRHEYDSFGEDVFEALPQVQPWEIQNVIFYGVNIYSNGEVNVDMRFLVSSSQDPGHYCSTRTTCDGEFVLSKWRFRPEAFNIEFGPRHSLQTPQLSFYPRRGTGVFDTSTVATENGTDQTAVQVIAIVFEHSRFYAGFMPFYE